MTMMVKILIHWCHQSLHCVNCVWFDKKLPYNGQFHQLKFEINNEGNNQKQQQKWTYHYQKLTRRSYCLVSKGGDEAINWSIGTSKSKEISDQINWKYGNNMQWWYKIDQSQQ